MGNLKQFWLLKTIALNMNLVRSLLGIGKYSVLEAEDAESGIQLARENHPDLILMDIQLPGMDGLTATSIIKADQKVKCNTYCRPHLPCHGRR